GVVLGVDVLNVSLLVFRRFRVADVIDVEAQGLRQVVEPVELEFAIHRWRFSWLVRLCRVIEHARQLRMTQLRRTVNTSSRWRLVLGWGAGPEKGRALCRSMAVAARVCARFMMAGCQSPSLILRARARQGGNGRGRGVYKS